MSQPKSNEELMTEFDIQQRLFLAGKLHSTKWNVWFKDVLAQKDKEVAEAVKAERERITAHLNLTRMAQIAKLNGRNDIASVYEGLNTELEALTPKE